MPARAIRGARGRSARAAAVLLALPLAVAGCGYRTGYAPPEDGALRSALPSVAVLPFDNATFRRGLEIRLTRFLSDELRARAGRAPAAPSAAAWTVTGSIVRAEERVLSEDRDDEVRESSLEIAVAVTLRERATEAYLGSKTFTEVAPFSPRAGRVATVEQARDEALRDLAERIVYWLEGRGHRLPANDKAGKHKESA